MRARLIGEAALAIAASATLASAALASPSSGNIVTTNFVTSDLTEDFQANHDRIKFQTKDPTTVRVQRLEFPPGSFTGFHHHPGVVIVAVQSGSLTLVDGDDCSSETHAAGTVFVEGADHSHQATSSGGATVFVTYIVPRDYDPPAEKFRVEEPVPFCAL